MTRGLKPGSRCACLAYRALSELAIHSADSPSVPGKELRDQSLSQSVMTGVDSKLFKYDGRAQFVSFRVTSSSPVLTSQDEVLFVNLQRAALRFHGPCWVPSWVQAPAEAQD